MSTTEQIAEGQPQEVADTEAHEKWLEKFYAANPWLRPKPCAGCGNVFYPSEGGNPDTMTYCDECC